jgi:flavodoxin
MKTAIVYYSYEENCACVAEILKGLLNADLYRIETLDTKRRSGLAKYAWGGSQVVMGKKPAIKPLAFDASAYEQIVLGTPVWAGSPSPPLVSFLSQNKIEGKRAALFICHAGGPGKAMEKLEGLIPGNSVISKLALVKPGAHQAGLTEKLSEWVKSFAIQ